MLNRDVKKIFRRIWIKTPSKFSFSTFSIVVWEKQQNKLQQTTVITSNNKNKQKGPMSKPTHRK